jgi:hypothetical protein
LRFWTNDVRRNIGSVMDRIVEALESAPATHGRQPHDAGPEPHFSPRPLRGLPLPSRGGKDASRLR